MLTEKSMPEAALQAKDANGQALLSKKLPISYPVAATGTVMQNVTGDGRGNNSAFSFDKSIS